MNVANYDRLENPTSQHSIKSDLFALLPLYEHSQLISKDQKSKFLNLLYSITSLSLEGLRAFKNNDFNKFDAQIGENLCQIRAYHTAFLARKYLDTENNCKFQNEIAALGEYQTKLENTINQWNDRVKHTSRYDKHLDAIESALEFLIRNNLLVELKDDIIYLAACYFLAHFSTKVNGILQSISLTRIAEELFISKSQAKKLVQTFQNTICKSGFNFACQILDDLPQLNHYKTLLPDLIKDSGDARLVLPCFAVSEIIFQHALFTQTPVLLTISRMGTYIPDTEVIYCLIVGDHFGNPILTDYKKIQSNACVVIEAEVNYGLTKNIETIQEYTERLVLNNPIQALLANTAMHPQYAGKQLQYLADNPYMMIPNSADKKIAEQSFHSMKEFAKNFGCHKEDPATLFMKHAYSDIIKNNIDHLKHSSNNIYDVHEQLNLGSCSINPETFNLIVSQPRLMTN